MTAFCPDPHVDHLGQSIGVLCIHVLVSLLSVIRHGRRSKEDRSAAADQGGHHCWARKWRSYPYRFTSSQNMQAVLRTQLNKQLESCELHLIEGQMDCRLAVRLESMQGIYLPQRDQTNLRWILTSPLLPVGTVKTHKLTYESFPSLFPRDAPSSVNRIIASPKTIQALLDFFAAKVNGELTMTCTKDGCSLRSKGEEMTEKRAYCTPLSWLNAALTNKFVVIHQNNSDRSKRK